MQPLPPGQSMLSCPECGMQTIHAPRASGLMACLRCHIRDEQAFDARQRAALALQTVQLPPHPVYRESPRQTYSAFDPEPPREKRGSFLAGLFKLVVLGALVLFIYAAIDGSARKDDGDEASQASTLPARTVFMSKLEAKISDGELLSRGVLSLEEYGSDGIRLSYRLNKPRPIMSRNEAEVICTGLVVFAVKVLIEEGHNPREHGTFVSGWAWQPAGKSVTNADQVRTQGHSYYDASSDKVIFEPAN